jgi:hypothetical protein
VNFVLWKEVTDVCDLEFLSGWSFSVRGTYKIKRIDDFASNPYITLTMKNCKRILILYKNTVTFSNAFTICDIYLISGNSIFIHFHSHLYPLERNMKA